uniref:HeH/LEM domain-containing protein n=1 Tax=viral metagenome TaxID=1070528 RepID=A0A6C0F4N9_9ZZZZ
MEFLHASIALLASMVLVLAGMVGWIYWQQTRLFQNMNAVALVIGDLNQSLMATVAKPRVELATVPEPTETLQHAEIPTSDEEDDDRLSVEKEAEVVTGAPPPLDTDGLQDKSKKELQELLTSRGIPYGKADPKNVLISLLKATA